MKKVLTIFCLCSIMGLSTASATTKEAPKYKTVCKTVGKNDKNVKECKKIRIHKKLDGTKVPENQKK